LNLSIFRANETYGTAYTSDFTGVFDTDGTITMTPAQYYQVDGSKSSKFIAVYPDNGTYIEAARTLEFDINGTTDIIASQVVEGSKDDVVDPMEFHHLLTQVQVKVVADAAADVDQISQQWGEVTGITITGKGGHALLTLPFTTDSYPGPLVPTGTQGVLTVAESAGDVLIPANGSTASYGYAMFLPVETADPLVFAITTTGGGTKTATTSSQTFLAGNAYEIILKFKLDGVEIDGGGANSNGARLVAWQSVTVPATDVNP
jgi:hypothetical protein